MYKLKGACHCGNIRVEVALTRAPAEYRPRACDCEFCRKHGASYLSDPGGSLAVQVGDERLLRKYRQGSNTAEMLVCGNCGVLVGGAYQTEGRVFAAINTRIIEGDAMFGEIQPVSPRTLSAEEKVSRWKALWFADVTIDAASGREPG